MQLAQQQKEREREILNNDILIILSLDFMDIYRMRIVIKEEFFLYKKLKIREIFYIGIIITEMKTLMKKKKKKTTSKRKFIIIAFFTNNNKNLC